MPEIINAPFSFNQIFKFFYLVIDSKNLIRFSNSISQTVLDYKKEELYNKNISTILNEKNLEKRGNFTLSFKKKNRKLVKTEASIYHLSYNKEKFKVIIAIPFEHEIDKNTTEYNLIISNFLNLPVFLCDDTGNVIDGNQHFFKIFELKKKKINLQALFPLKSSIKNIFKKLPENGSFDHFEFTTITPNKRNILFSLSLVGLRICDKRVITGILKDISLHKLFQNEMDRSHECFVRFMNSLPFCCQVYDKDFCLVEINLKGMEYFFPDKKKETLFGKPLSELLPFMKESGILNIAKEIIETRKDKCINDFILKLDGEEKVFDIHIFSLFNKIGFALIDVTEMRTLKKDLSYQTKLNELFIETCPDSVLLMDPQTKKIVFVNSAACFLFGYNKDEFIGLHISKLEPPESINFVNSVDENKICGNLTFNEYIPIITKYGQKKFVDINCAHIQLDGKKFLLGFFRNSTEKKFREDLLLNTSSELTIQNKLLSSFSTSNYKKGLLKVLSVLINEFSSHLGLLGVIKKNEDLILMMIRNDLNSSTKYKFISFKKGSWPKGIEKLINGERLDACLMPDFNLPLNNYISSSIKIDESTIGFILVANRKSGYTKNEEHTLNKASLWISPLVKTYIEFTVQKEEKRKMRMEKEIYEKELIQASKLATIGTLASGIAHELNNPLSAVKGFAQLIFRDPNVSLDIKNNASQIIEAAIRMQKIIEYLRTFSRKTDKVDRKAINILTAIEHSSNFLDQRIRTNNVKLEIQKISDQLMVVGDLTQLESVFQNLFTNSLDAFESVKDGREKKIQILCGINPLGDITIEYKDNAGGMPQEVMDRIFEPFFTTKEVGKGTGLGMSLVHNIIKSHKGTISVSSIEPVGTTFIMTFPAYFEKNTDTLKHVEFTSESIKTLKPKILVIDDELLVTNLLAQYLKDNFEVDKVNSPIKGLQMIKNGNYKLVLIDIKMPEMNGIELITKIKEIDSDIPVVLMTGSVGIMEKEAELYRLGAKGILRKPFEGPDELKKYLSEILMTLKLAA